MKRLAVLLLALLMLCGCGAGEQSAQERKAAYVPGWPNDIDTSEWVEYTIDQGESCINISLPPEYLAIWDIAEISDDELVKGGVPGDSCDGYRAEATRLFDGGIDLIAIRAGESLEQITIIVTNGAEDTLTYENALHYAQRYIDELQTGHEITYVGVIETKNHTFIALKAVMDDLEQYMYITFNERETIMVDAVAFSGTMTIENKRENHTIVATVENKMPPAD